MLMRWTMAAVCLLVLTGSVRAQIAAVEPEAGPAQYGEPVVQRFRVGAEITASRGACRNIKIMVALPLECPEQEVITIEEDFSSDIADVKYRNLGEGARQMLISIPELPAGATSRSIATFEVRTRPILPPDEGVLPTLVIPKKASKEIRPYTMPSPFIEIRDKRIRGVASDLWQESEAADSVEVNDWQRIHALYDYVQDNIKYVEDSEDKSAADTLRDGKADCHGRSALFVALCRASDVPARIVWVNNHCYAEFYLEDSAGAGHWFPAESAGTRAFGEMPLARTILQKGDNFRVPERPRDRLRYASDYMVGVPLPGSGTPKVRYIREEVAE